CSRTWAARPCWYRRRSNFLFGVVFQPFLKKGWAKNFMQHRTILSADTASEVRQMPSQKRR
ncbi:MAG: hypothetical protein PUJ34_05465, partial [Subdoligranulum sp.]|nr:hypothetical protein [Subdoligranulum sp.]